MKNRMIFFDIDGTLYSYKQGKVPDNAVKGIKAVQKQGVYCFIASGRPWGFIASNIKEIGFDGYILTNGANVKFNNKDLVIRNMDVDKVKAFISILKEHHIEYILQTNEYCYMDKDNELLYEFYTHCNIDMENIKFDYNEEDIIDHVVKIEVWSRNLKEREIVYNNNQGFSVELHPDNHSMEIYSSTVSKATGIKDAIELLNVDETYCFGDGPNDFEMFSCVDHPYAMGNALDDLKKEAEEVLDDIDHDGIYKQLMKVFHI